MGIRNWVANKIFDINGTIQKEVDNVMENTFTYRIPGQEAVQNLLLKYRQSENLVWKRGSASELSKFYSAYDAPGEVSTESRQLFWEWASAVKNVPKVHFPTPDIIMGQMKSLLFSEELMIDIKTDDEELDVIKNEELKDILFDNSFYEMLQNGSNIEVYSGTLGLRFIVNTEYEEYPIMKLYPAEDMRFKTYMGRIQEIIFLDKYIEHKKVYTLRSIYGKGYINFELRDDKERTVPLDTIDELADLQNVIFVGPDGKPIKKLMALVKKNRSTSNEFPDMAYGGSDFEGLTDTFQMIDELYSTKLLYTRRTRPSQSLTQDLLTWDDKTKKYLIPKEYEQDTIILNPVKEAKDNTGFKRDIPTIDFLPYTEAIKDELRSVWMKIGMAYTSVGLEAHSGNISNDALLTKEKSTVIVRANKEKLWKKFLIDAFQLALIFNSLKTLPAPRETKEGVTYTLPDLFEYTYTVEFPEYSKQSFEERLDMVIKGLAGGAFDQETGIERLFKDELTTKEKAVVLYKTKIENSVPIIQDEIPSNLNKAEEDTVKNTEPTETEVENVTDPELE